MGSIGPLDFEVFCIDLINEDDIIKGISGIGWGEDTKATRDRLFLKTAFFTLSLEILQIFQFVHKVRRMRILHLCGCVLVEC